MDVEPHIQAKVSNEEPPVAVEAHSSNGSTSQGSTAHKKVKEVVPPQDSTGGSVGGSVGSKKAMAQEVKDNGQTAGAPKRAVMKNRKVGRWFLGETLGKGGYSWVKKGYDRKDGRVVALKFTSKARENWSESQSKQIQNEIEALRQIKHKHVLQLLAYNLNGKYPQKDGVVIPSVLLVLEYLPGGELFDILYYTQALEENIARTYFKQLMVGLEACHAAGICHRDIKPQNLLLDQNFQLKIADFGLAKVFEKDSDALMTTFYVGTRGYQAPEILKKEEYTVACDIFSCGVVLFILLSGYPPFEAASTKCRWYSPLAAGNAREFWKQHRGCGIPGKAKDLITRMLWYDKRKRIDISKIKKHKWFQGATLSEVDLANSLKQLHRLMEIKRKNDPDKMKNLQDSVKRDIMNFCVIYDKPPPKGVEVAEFEKVALKKDVDTEIKYDFYNGQVLTRCGEILEARVTSALLPSGKADCKALLAQHFHDTTKQQVVCDDLVRRVIAKLLEVDPNSLTLDDGAKLAVYYSNDFHGCEPPQFPDDEAVTIKDVFTTEQPATILLYVKQVALTLGGVASVDFEDASMEVSLATHNVPAPVTIGLRLFLFRNASEEQPEPIYLVKFERIYGDALNFSRVLKRVVSSSSPVLTGLPDKIFKATDEEKKLASMLETN